MSFLFAESMCWKCMFGHFLKLSTEYSPISRAVLLKIAIVPPAESLLVKVCLLGPAPMLWP